MGASNTPTCGGRTTASNMQPLLKSPGLGQPSTLLASASHAAAPQAQFILSFDPVPLLPILALPVADWRTARQPRLAASAAAGAGAVCEWRHGGGPDRGAAVAVGCTTGLHWLPHGESSMIRLFVSVVVVVVVVGGGWGGWFNDWCWSHRTCAPMASIATRPGQCYATL